MPQGLSTSAAAGRPSEGHPSPPGTHSTGPEQAPWRLGSEEGCPSAMRHGERRRAAGNRQAFRVSRSTGRCGANRFHASASTGSYDWCSAGSMACRAAKAAPARGPRSRRFGQCFPDRPSVICVRRLHSCSPGVMGRGPVGRARLPDRCGPTCAAGGHTTIRMPAHRNNSSDRSVRNRRNQPSNRFRDKVRSGNLHTLDSP